MPAPQGLITYSGISTDFVVGGDYTLAHGISPGTFNLTVVPNPEKVEACGDVEIVFGSTRLKFPDCALVQGSLQINSGGQRWNLRILDRRWQWKYHWIRGHYNRRRKDGTVDDDIENNEKTPRELAALLLKAMGEKDFDVDKLPNKRRPEVSWDYANPAAELAKLCDSLGARVVLGIDNKVRLWPVGKGKQLPAGGAVNAGVGHEQGAKPEHIDLVTAPAVFQAKFWLEAVGEETDETILPIDKLSYRPAAGWGAPGDEKVKNYKRHGERHTTSELAEKTVYRWYRVLDPARAAVNMADIIKLVKRTAGITIRDRKQIVLLPSLVRIEGGKPELEAAGSDRADPYIHGRFYLEGVSRHDSISDFDTRWPHGFSLDTEKQLCRLSAMAFRTIDGSLLPAALVLHVAFHVRNNTGNLVPQRIRKRVPGAKKGAGSLVVRAPELVPVVFATYDEPDVPFDINVRGLLPSLSNGSRDNFKAIRKEGLIFIEGRLREFKNSGQSGDVTYAGIRAIMPDGAIQQVRWQVGRGREALTRAGRNSEPFNILPSYEERRRREKAIDREEKVESRLDESPEVIRSRLRGPKVME